MNLRINKHPNKQSAYCVSDIDYYVVGTNRWLVHKDNLPRNWYFSIFHTKREAQEYIDANDETDAVTLEETKLFYRLL